MVKIWKLAGYITAALLIGASLVLILMFGINFGYIKSLIWVSVFLIALVKRHILWDNFFAFIYSLKDVIKTKEPPKDVIFDDETGTADHHELDVLKRREDIAMENLWNRRYVADEQSEAERKERERLNIYYNTILNDFFMFFFYMVTLLLIVLGSRDPLAYYSTANIQELLSSYKYGFHVQGAQTNDLIYHFVLTNLVENTNRGTDFNGEYISDEFGWVSGRIGKILGVIRLRQHRIAPNKCIQGQLRENCLGVFYFNERDTQNYDQGWKPKTNFFYSNKFWRITEPWMYKDGTESRSVPYFGDLGFYPGGGYIAYMGRNYNNSLNILRYLKANHWLDRRTAVLFIEFTLYNVDANLFNIVSIMLEKTPQGLFKPTANILSLKLLLIIENLPWLAKAVFVLFLILTIVFFYRIMVTVWNAKFKSFISKPWNIVDMIIVLISIFTFAFYFVRNDYVISLIRELDDKRKNEFVSFQFAALYDSLLVTISAFLVLLSTIRLWKILNFAKMFRILANTLSKATIPLIASSLLTLVLCIGMSICLTIINGSNAKTFQHFQESLVSVVIFSIGFGESIDAETVFLGGKTLGIILFAVGIIAICIIAIFLFATTLCYHFSAEKEDFQKHGMPLYSFWTFLKEEFQSKFRPKRTACRLDEDPNTKKKKQRTTKKWTTKRCGGEYTASKAKMVNEAIEAQMNYLNKYIDEILRKS